MGDFNSDYSLKNDVNYRYANMFSDFDSVFDNVNLIQMVEFPTWSRIIIPLRILRTFAFLELPTLLLGTYLLK